MRFLSLLAAYPTAPGSILEIGSFKGRSTIILAKASKFAGDSAVYAVDPLTSPSATDPDLGGALSAKADFESNLSIHGVTDRVRFHRMTSQELAPLWSSKIRLLWIDGDHTYGGTKADFDLFHPWLEDGAIIALHDVLNIFDGPIRVFSEDILGSPHFVRVGLCGSIGWGQYSRAPQKTFSIDSTRRLLQKRILKLRNMMNLRPQKGISHFRYKFLRWQIPHELISPKEWIAGLAQSSVEQYRGSGA